MDQKLIDWLDNYDFPEFKKVREKIRKIIDNLPRKVTLEQARKQIEEFKL